MHEITCVCQCTHPKLKPLLFVFLSSLRSHQTVQLGHGALAPWLADVPHLDAALASSVDVARGGADGDGAHHLSVVQRVDLTGVTRDARTQQGVGWKRHRLHLAIRTHMERVGAERDRRKRKDRN